MHILIIHQAFASLDEPGGTRHYEFASWLAAHGHRVTLIASPVSYITGARSLAASAPPDVDRDPRLTILRASVYSAHHRSFGDRMLAFFTFMWSSFWLGLRVPDVDLVWGTSPPIFQAVTAWLLARLKRAKFLLEVRDLWPLFAVAVGVLKNPLLISASEWLERLLCRQADCVIVNSPGFVDHVRRCGARRVELVPNGADPAMFDPSSDGRSFRDLHGLGGGFVAMYAGAHGMSNDLDVVLEAARLLGDTPARLVFVGDGKEKPVLQAKAAAWGLSNVTFLPPEPKRRMPEVLAAADACIAILKPIDAYKTTYPNKVFDYMAAGKPVVLAIDGVIRSVVEAAGCGIFVPPGDPAAMAAAIRRLMADREAALRMGVDGRNYLLRNFDREQSAVRLLQIIESLVPRRRIT